MKLLVLGGTRESNALSAVLIEHGYSVVISLAGRTREPTPARGQCRVGGFGGIDGLVRYLQDESIDAMIDATHPFAEAITANAIAAARLVNLPFVVLWREPWRQRQGDDWRPAATISEAASLLPSGAIALVALGHQHVAPFLARSDLQLILRSIEPINGAEGLAHVRTIRARPAPSAEQEARFLREIGATHVVSRNSGGPGAYAKIEAARTLGLPVIMIDRPMSPSDRVGTVDDVVHWLNRLKFSA